MKKILTIFLLLACHVTSLFSATQAIIFDFGGVITDGPNRKPVITFLQETFGLSQSEFDRVNRDKREAVKLGKSDEEFWIDYANANGIVLPENWGATFKRVMITAIGVKPQMYIFVEELRKKPIRIGMLSNIDSARAKLIRECGFYEPFDPCLLSCEIGFDKPDPRAFKALIDALDLPAGDIVFIDDNPENVAAAKALGIDAILFKSEEQLRQELSKR